MDKRKDGEMGEHNYVWKFEGTDKINFIGNIGGSIHECNGGCKSFTNADFI